MPNDTRARMVRAAARLFRDRGYLGTGLRDIVASAHAPRGSIYHHFPGGKEQLADEVVRWVGSSLTDRIDELTGTGTAPATALRSFIDLASATLVHGSGRPGCPIAAVALGGYDAPQLLAAAAEAFTGWERAVAASLTRTGVPAPEAASFATLTVAALEGALILCRARGDDEPLREVGAQLQACLPTVPSRQ